MNPVCVSTWADERKYFKDFIRTANKHGIDPQNADPNTWPGKDWKDIEWWRKSDAQCRYVEAHKGEFTHFMFTDSYDIVFAAGWDEILEKYKALDSPIVFGAESYPWPDKEQADLYPKTDLRCRYLNAGFWIAEAEAAYLFTQYLSLKAAEKTRCDQGICVDMLLSGHYPIKLDNRCSLLHCCNNDSLSLLEYDQIKGRLVNTDTGKSPVLFHGNGNADLSSIISKL